MGEFPEEEDGTDGDVPSPETVESEEWEVGGDEVPRRKGSRGRSWRRIGSEGRRRKQGEGGR